MSERDLDRLFSDYRAACPDVEPGTNFLPQVWERIEARRGFWPVFEHLARIALTMCAFACLVFGLLNFAGERRSVTADQTYADALAAEQGPEATFYADVMYVTGGAREGSQ